MSEIFELNLLLNTECNSSNDSTWEFSCSASESGISDIISSLQMTKDQDYPDLDDLLDIGETPEIVNPSSFDSNVGVMELYSDPTEINQLQFKNQIEFEKEKLAKENEAGLLEALQQSMDMECNSVTDLVSFSSTLDLPQSLTTTNCFPSHKLVPSFENLEVSVESAEDESMLKRLLLSPTYDSYPKEIDANNNTMVLESADIEIPESSEDIRRQKCQYQPRETNQPTPLTKKPFTELLKHLESSSMDKLKDPSKNKTRVLNMSRYLRQYGSAPVSRVSSPLANSEDKQILPRHLKRGGKLNNPTEIKNIRASKTLELTPNREVDLKNIKSTNDRRRGAVLIEPLPKKRQRLSIDSVHTKNNNFTNSKQSDILQECTEKPSAEHDYCQQQLDDSSDSDILSAAIKASGLNSKTKKDKNKQQRGEMSQEALAKSANKVLKWEEYLQRVRLGIRSAPNSPTCSPKMKRGSARPINNFMVALAAANTASNVTSPSPQPTVLKPPIIQAQMPKQKQAIKLQEFQDYLANLQANQEKKNLNMNDNLHIVKFPQIPDSNSIEVSKNLQKPSVKSQKPKKRSKFSSKPIVIPAATSQTFLKINSGGTIHTVAVTSANMVPQNSSSMMMIQLPQLSNVAGSSVINVNPTPSSPCVLTTAVQPTQIIQCQPAQILIPSTKTDNKLLDPRANTKISKRTVNLKPIPRERWSKAKNNKPVVTSTTNTSSAPTFKLITSNKEGAGSKSVILSGVTGQLKEILTLLSQQQQEDGNLMGASTHVSTQQQKTLQQLLSAIAELKSKKPLTNVTTTSATMLTSVAQDKTASIAGETKESKILECKTQRKSHVPSPLSLIHEIKQNMTKKCGSTKKTIQPRYVYTVPAKNTTQTTKSPTNCIITAGGALLKTCSANSTGSQVKPEVNSLDGEESPITVFVDGSDSDFNQKDVTQCNKKIGDTVQSNNISTVEKCVPKLNILKCKTEKVTENTSSANAFNKPENVISKKAMNFEIISEKSTMSPPFNGEQNQSTITTMSRAIDTAPKHDNCCSLKNIITDNVVNKVVPVQALQTNVKSSKERPELVPICSIAASEMMANEIMTEDQQEDMLWDQSLQVQQNVGNEIESDVGVEFYNKLPAYLYNGKVNPEAKVNQLGTGNYSPPHDPPTSKLGLKELSCDPLIGTDGPNTEIHYNKLPHYFSSGKLEPTPSQGESIQFGSSGQQPQGLVTSSKIKCTPHGALLNLDDTYYSRLPNYYNYGRPHVVGTVTEPPEIEDETVTSQSLLKADAKRQERRTERKRKASKKLPRVDNRVDGDRILYSKIPQYYLSGRKPLVPKRRTSEHSFSSSESSDEDYRGRTRRRSSCRKSCSRSPRRSFSRSSSRSRSPRSWRDERPYLSDSRNYSSSESDYESYSRPSKRKRRNESSSVDWGAKRKKKDERKKEQHNKAIQDRRVMYVGRISHSTTQNDLRNRFQNFGEIEDVTLYFRQDRDSYGFVTFRYTCDTFTAIEQGNNGDVEPKYDLCFGGRRQFCQVEYADLDEGNEDTVPSNYKNEEDFDSLLRKAMRR